MPDIQSRRVWIFANGDLPDPELLKALLRPGDGLIAADGGHRHLARLGLMPGWLVGDMDSLPEDEVRELAFSGVVLEKHPVDKDETDLELAVNRAIREGYRHIRIAGATGGRLDQTLGNIFLMARPALDGVDIRLEDGLEEVFLIHDENDIDGNPGDTVSLLPWGKPAEGVRTTGLKYPLNDETLFADRTRGISNEMVAPQAHVSLVQGILICIHRRHQYRKKS